MALVTERQEVVPCLWGYNDTQHKAAESSGDTFSCGCLSLTHVERSLLNTPSVDHFTGVASCCRQNVPRSR